MARISVEQKALTDPRFELLGRLLRSNRHEALGRMIHVWNECQERMSYVLPNNIVGALLGDRDGAEWLIQADLAVSVETDDEPITNQSSNENDPTPVTARNLRRTNIGSGREPMLVPSVRIRGTEGRIEWLGAKRYNASTNGKKGGRKPKTDPNQPSTKDEPKTNQAGLPAGTPPAPAPALNRERKEPSANGNANGHQMVNGHDVLLSASDRELAWEQFHFSYPNSTKDHPEAKLSWDLLPLTANMVKEIMAGLSLWRRCSRWRDPLYIHDAKNFLGREVWKEPPPKSKKGKPSDDDEPDETDTDREARYAAERKRIAGLQ